MPEPKLDHIAIVVEDLDEGIARYEAVLGVRFERFEDDEELDCHWARAPTGGGTSFELVAPRSPASPYARHLERRGSGLHHVSFDVTDVAEERGRLEAAGLGVLGFSLDHAGWQECFVHPRHTDGVLVHLCVPPPEHAGPLEETTAGAPAPAELRGAQEGEGDV